MHAHMPSDHHSSGRHEAREDKKNIETRSEGLAPIVTFLGGMTAAALVPAVLGGALRTPLGLGLEALGTAAFFLSP
jgi:hypothetical protein